MSRVGCGHWEDWDIDQLEGTVLLHVQTAAIAIDERGASGCSIRRPRASSTCPSTAYWGGTSRAGRRGAGPRRPSPASSRDAPLRCGAGASPGHRDDAERGAHARLHVVAAAAGAALRRSSSPTSPTRSPRSGTRGRGAALRRGRPHRRRHGARAQVATGHRRALRQPDAAGARGRSRRRPATRRHQGPDACSASTGWARSCTPSTPTPPAPAAWMHTRWSRRSCATWSRSCAAATRPRASPCASSGNGTRAAIAENDLRSVVSNLISNAIEATAGRGRSACGAHRRRRGDDHRGRPRPGAARRRRVRGLLHDQVRAAPGWGSGSCAAWSRTPAAASPPAAAAAGGAVFTVSMPLPRHDRLRGLPVLLIEDDAPLRRATTAALESCGARVTAAVSGKDVPLEAASGVRRPRLPPAGHDGVEIATRLAPATPVLLVSGDPIAGVALAEVRGRRAWYLPKPFEVDVYLDLVSLLVGAT